MEIIINNYAHINPTAIGTIQNAAMAMLNPERCSTHLVGTVTKDSMCVAVDMDGIFTREDLNTSPMVHLCYGDLTRTVYLELETYIKCFGTSFDKLKKWDHGEGNFCAYEVSAYFGGVEFRATFYPDSWWCDVPTEWERLF